MPVICFSGGIDSTVLAYDVSKHPYRYGVEVREDTVLTLLCAGGPEKRKQLKPIIDHLMTQEIELPVELKVVDDSVLSSHRASPPPRGVETVNPLIIRSTNTLLAMPHTSGWMLWFAAVALGVLRDCEVDSFNPAQVFIGHQVNGPEWGAIDRGELKGYDCLPDFFVALNEAIRISKERVVVRCPFLEQRMDRLMILQLGKELGVPFRKTSSCMQGWQRRCGACHPCVTRQAAFRRLKDL